MTKELLRRTKEELESERRELESERSLHRDLYEQAQRAVRDASRRQEDLQAAERDLADRNNLHQTLSKENASLSSEIQRLRQQLRAKTQQLNVANDVHQSERAADIDKMRLQISQLLEEKSFMIEELESKRVENIKVKTTRACSDWRCIEFSSVLF